MSGRFRPGAFWASSAKRISVVVFAVVFVVVALLPRQAQFLLHKIGQPFADVIAVPIEGMAIIDRGIREWWMQYIALQGVSERNRELRKKVRQLKGELNQLREQALAAERFAALLEFQKQESIRTVAARVIGRSLSNWYQGVILNKGEDDGIRVEMGVITPTGMVGQIVRTAGSTSIALLAIDPNVAVTGVVQRTRDEGIVQGTSQGLVRMKYIPPLSSVKKGDAVITSGLTGGFPRGVLIGNVSRVEESEDGLFQTAEIAPAVQFRQLDEVLIVLSPRSPEAVISLDQALVSHGRRNPTP